MYSFECIYCLSTFNASYPFRNSSLPCKHQHCNACLRRFYTHSISVIPFQPVICCSPEIRIPLRFLQGRLDLSNLELATYRSKLAEFDAASKLYCFDRQCGVFIPLALRTERTGRCRKCKKTTCIKCHEQAHTGPCLFPQQVIIDGAQLGQQEVKEYLRRLIVVEKRGGNSGAAKGATNRLTLLKAAIESEVKFDHLARCNGWKACPSCHRWTEKTTGCNHITCPCGTHWCYRCGKAPYGSHGECAM